ncbi:MAG TPA: hypothetical protein VGC22_00455 [Chitinophaga sp.]
MQRFRVFVLAGILSAASLGAGAQTVTLSGGKLKALDNIDTLNIVFDYSKLTVGEEGKEANYIKRKKAELDKKEEGRGDKWEQAWLGDRQAHYEPKFIETFNANAKGLVLVQDSSKPLTMVYKVLFIEPGYNVGISRKNASANGEAWVINPAEPKKALVKFRVMDAPGGSFFRTDFDAAGRITTTFVNAAKGLAKQLSKDKK